VTLVDIAGNRKIQGGSNLASSLSYDSSPEARNQAVAAMVAQGFSHVPADLSSLTSSESIRPFSMSRQTYASMYGPTTGDRLRLGDTDLWIRVEKDLTVYGDELKFGGGKTVRDGMGQACGVSDKDALDVVITNALIVDWSGIYKADIGIKKGYIVGIGKAGNPNVMEGVSDGMVVGVTTEVIAAEKLIVTAGAIDAHVHCERPFETSLVS
jgi:urease